MSNNHVMCHCCPYGFHIDRDFVHYCESLYNITQLEKLKQKKREKRKELLTLESCLGITTVNSSYNNDNKISLSRNSVSQNIAASIKMLSVEGLCCGTIGIQRDVLTKIRDQMASSLKHMKELEEQVKILSTLQVELLALKKEKNMLLHLLKAKQFESLENGTEFMKTQDFHTTELLRSEISKYLSDSIVTLGNENLASPAIASCLNDEVSKMHSLTPEVISLNSSISKIPTEKNVRNVGTFCSVLTRDIGVGHIENKFKSTGVGEENISNIPLCFYCFQEKQANQFVSMSSESLESDSDSLCGGKTDFFSQKSCNQLPKTCMKYITIPPEHTKNILSLWHRYEVTDSPSAEIKASKNNDVHLSEVLLNSPQLEIKQNVRNNKHFYELPHQMYNAVQVSEMEHPIHKITANVAVQTKECSSYSILKSFTTCDVAVGDCRTDDVVCQKCSKKSFKNVSIGQCSVFDIICDRCVNKNMQSVGCDAQSFDVLCKRCVQQNITEIYVEKNVNQPALDYTCKKYANVNTRDEKPLVRSIGIGSEFIFSNIENEKQVYVCDKCNATVPMQDFITKDGDTIKSCVNEKYTQNFPAPLDLQPTSEMISFSNVGRICPKKIDIKSDSPSELLQYSTSDLSELEEPCPFKGGDAYGEFAEESVLCENKNLQSSINPFNVIETNRVKLSQEIETACKMYSDYLQKPERRSEKKAISSNKIIEKVWFQIANLKNADPHTIESYLDAFEEISRPLLQYIVNLSDNNGNTAIHYAVSYSNFDVVSILIDSKVCDVNRLNKAGYTCIMLLALADLRNDVHNYVVQRLFQMGDINIKSKQNGQTALMLAASQGKLQIVQMLLDAGSEINLQDNDGSTALMCASEHGHINIVQLLLLHQDCDSTISDSDGSNALSIAMEAGYKDIGLLIYANMNFSRGNSPYSVKEKRHHAL